MIRGLLIRRAFFLVDVVLLAVLGILGAKTLFRALESPPDFTVPTLKPTDATDLEGYFKPVEQRSAYLPIAANRLFGDAGTVIPDPKEVPPPPKEEVVETTLPLELRGTATAGPGDPTATAIIANKQTGVAKTYYIGQTVINRVILFEVDWNQVRLKDEAANQIQILRREGDEELMALSAARRAAATEEDGQAVVVEAKKLQEQFGDQNYRDLLTKAKPVEAKDPNGNVIGMTSETIEDIPLAKDMGLQNGDILQSVNGVKIDSERKIFEVANRFQNEKSFKITIMRNGRPQTLSYTLQ